MVRVFIGVVVARVDARIKSRVILTANVLSQEFNGGESEW